MKKLIILIVFVTLLEIINTKPTRVDKLFINIAEPGSALIPGSGFKVTFYNWHILVGSA